ncbi:MAG: NADH-quinone oxidoreductase subunit H [Candidatus Marinimicrobia bacterium]|nr:NADH-quinone oxidoreductase subunit H [Candidatus Neomarinimicrobiota bacterium]
MEFVVMHISEIILSPLLALIVGVFFLGLSRKIMARIHWRYGPPITQPVIDIIRMFSQKSVSHGNLFNFGIIFSIAGSIAVVLFIPFGRIHPLSNSGGLLVILYIMLLAPLGIALSSGEAANPNSSIGISRKLLLTLGYEFSLLLILLALMTHYRTISITEIVALQQKGSWSLFRLPLVLPGIAYILILPAILGVRPFEISKAPQEISSGPMVEYGGTYLALAKIEHAFAIVIGISLFVNLFLGGANNLAFFFLKVLLVFILGIFINAVFPRLRTEQAIKYLFGIPAFLAFLGLVITVLI